ncbi:MAG: hypothetical protein DRN12_02325 [Thermoplasmata archaeon]|nr:MAG: hypothetical protein DRN12_02325 [Thermoplasmata archaeon]
MTEVIIENIVTSAVLKQPIAIEEVASKIPDATYVPEEFPGIVFHFSDPKIDVLLFPDGRIVCTGARKYELAKEKIEDVLEKLKEKGFTVEEENMEITNIIASHDLENMLPIDKIVKGLSTEDITYDSNRFPGAIYHYNNHIVLLIFPNGKIVCIGAKTIEELLRVLKEFKEKLSTIEGVAI